MSAGWIAGTVRAHGLVARLPGDRVASEVAATTSLAGAIVRLQSTIYREDLHHGMDVIDVQRVLAASVLWRLRVLAGWVPLAGAALVRALAGWFEIAVIEGRLEALRGASPPTPFVMGRLGLVTSRLGSASTAEAVRSALAASPWGDPGDMSAASVRAHLLARWAERVRDLVPEAARWAAEAQALAVARGIRAGRAASSSADAVMAAAPAASRAFVSLALEDPWPAESTWWRRVDGDAHAMMRRTVGAREIVVGACALMAVDAHRMASAVEIASRGGGSLEDADAA